MVFEEIGGIMVEGKVKFHQQAHTHNETQTSAPAIQKPAHSTGDPETGTPARIRGVLGISGATCGRPGIAW